MLSWPAKDPDEVLDYSIDWGTNRLQTGETIDTSDWSVITGSVVIAGSPAPSINAGTTTVWLTGGTDGDVCELNNKITTSVGRIYEQLVRLRIREH